MANKFDILDLLCGFFFGNNGQTLLVLCSRLVQRYDPPNDRRIAKKRLYRHERLPPVALRAFVAVLFQEGIFQISIPTDIRLRYLSEQCFDLVPHMSSSLILPLLFCLFLFLIPSHLLLCRFWIFIIPIQLHTIQIFGVSSSPMNSPSV